MVQVGKVSLNEETAGLETGHSFSAVVYKHPDSGVDLWGVNQIRNVLKRTWGMTCCFLVTILIAKNDV
jgi:hypothetical protein